MRNPYTHTERVCIAVLTMRRPLAPHCRSVREQRRKAEQGRVKAILPREGPAWVRAMEGPGVKDTAPESFTVTVIRK